MLRGSSIEGGQLRAFSLLEVDSGSNRGFAIFEYSYLLQSVRYATLNLKKSVALAEGSIASHVRL